MSSFLDYIEKECNFVENPFLASGLVEQETFRGVDGGGTREASQRLGWKNGHSRHGERKNDLSECVVRERNVFERLTDPRYYTGIHRERFDENGNGRGLAGRENIYLFDGSTESYSRVHEVYSSVVAKKPRAVLTPGTLGVQKFGVQIATPKLMWLYRNGDKFHNGVPFYIRPFIKNMDTLLYEMSKELTLIAGPIRRIYDQNLKRVTDICEIVDGAKYLCTSGEPPASKNRLEKFMSEWVIQTF